MTAPWLLASSVIWPLEDVRPKEFVDRFNPSEIECLQVQEPKPWHWFLDTLCDLADKDEVCEGRRRIRSQNHPEVFIAFNGKIAFQLGEV